MRREENSKREVEKDKSPEKKEMYVMRNVEKERRRAGKAGRLEGGAGHARDTLFSGAFSAADHAPFRSCPTPSPLDTSSSGSLSTSDASRTPPLAIQVPQTQPSSLGSFTHSGTISTNSLRDK